MRNLKPNHSTRTPGSWIFVDTETIGQRTLFDERKERHVFRLGVAIHVRTERGRIIKEETYRIKTVADFWRWLYSRTSKHRPTWVYAHNLGFDATILQIWQELESGALKLTAPPTARQRAKDKGKRRRQRRGVLVTEDPPSFYRLFTRDNHTLVFVDSLNYWRCSLEELGSWAGTPKLAMPGPDGTETDWWDYCERDALVLRNAVMRLIGRTYDEDLGVWKTTAPSLAMAAYRHRFRQDQITFHEDDRCRALERDAYYGGHAEVWFQGRIVDRKTPQCPEYPLFHPWRVPVREGPVYVLDLQSAYPWAMKCGHLPRKLHGLYADVDEKTFDVLRRMWACVAHVLVNSPRETYPVRVEGQSLHCTGRFWTSLAGPELDRAAECGHVVRVAAIAAFVPGELFGRWVDYWWGQKLSATRIGDSVGRELAKLCLNSLLGKLVQRGRRWEVDEFVPCPCPWGNFVYLPADGEGPWQCRSIAWTAQHYADETEHPEAFPAIGAVVTARVRERLRQLRQLAGAENVWYQDTDSLHCNQDGYNRLCAAGEVQPECLGFLDLKGTYQTAEYRNVKDYSLDGVDVIAGLKRSAIRVGPDTYEQLTFERTRSVLDRVPDGSIVVGRELFTPHRYYSRGRVGSDGFFRPFVLHNHPSSQPVLKALWPEQVSDQTSDEER